MGPAAIPGVAKAITIVSGVLLPGLANEIRGGEPVDFPEAFGKIGGTPKAGFIGGIRAVEALPEEFGSLGQPEIPNDLGSGKAGEVFQLPMEAAPAQIEEVYQLIDAKVGIVQVRFHLCVQTCEENILDRQRGGRARIGVRVVRLRGIGRRGVGRLNNQGLWRHRPAEFEA